MSAARRLWATLGSLLACLFVTTAAVADEDPALPATPTEAPQPTPEKAHDDLLFTAGVGAFHDVENAVGGGGLSLTALRQKGWLGYGATFEYGGAVLDYTSVTAAPMVGLFLDSPRYLRLGFAAVGGIHHYSGVNGGFILSRDPGASGTTAFLGARVLAGVELGGKSRFHIGVQLSADDDLSRSRKTYAFEESTFRFGGDASTTTETATHTVGTFRYGGMLVLGTAFDL